MMKEVTKVFVGAYTLMANGNLISRVGIFIYKKKIGIYFRNCNYCNDGS